MEPELVYLSLIIPIMQAIRMHLLYLLEIFTKIKPKIKFLITNLVILAKKRKAIK